MKTIGFGQVAPQFNPTKQAASALQSSAVSFAPSNDGFQRAMAPAPTFGGRKGGGGWLAPLAILAALAIGTETGRDAISSFWKNTPQSKPVPSGMSEARERFERGRATESPSATAEPSATESPSPVPTFEEYPPAPIDSPELINSVYAKLSGVNPDEVLVTYKPGPKQPFKGVDNPGSAHIVVAPTIYNDGFTVADFSKFPEVRIYVIENAKKDAPSPYYLSSVAKVDLRLNEEPPTGDVQSLENSGQTDNVKALLEQFLNAKSEKTLKDPK